MANAVEVEIVVPHPLYAITELGKHDCRAGISFSRGWVTNDTTDLLDELSFISEILVNGEYLAAGVVDSLHEFKLVHQKYFGT